MLKIHGWRIFVCNFVFEGPTSYGPVIEAAIDIVEKNRGQFHVLVIVADGQVYDSTCVSVPSCMSQILFTYFCLIWRLQEVSTVMMENSVLKKKRPSKQLWMQGRNRKLIIRRQPYMHILTVCNNIETPQKKKELIESLPHSYNRSLNNSNVNSKI